MIKVMNNGGIALHTHLNQVSREDLKHQMRHPAETFDLKINRLLSALKDLDLEVQSNVERDTQFDIDESMAKKLFTYVQTVDELYDASFLIMKSLNDTITSENQDAIKWCQSNCNEPYSEFKGAVDGYHKLIRMISNKVKHDSLRVDFVSLVNNRGIKTFGFYFSNVIGDNNLNGADVDIHQKYKDSSTAFSYNYFISYTLGLIFYLIDKLNSALFKGKKLKNNDYIGWSAGVGLLNIFQKYNEDFFPDEYEKYCMRLEKNKNTMKVVFPYKANSAVGYHVTSVQPFFRVGQPDNEMINKFPYHTLIWA
ncbi:hypothetical protein B9J90_04035 [Vibrio sp. V09_P4A23P171]|uniref:hypothetical protein n=1 Tax=Vibrio sp. V09_P4A23P171 TaxID=1938664 RepID=UPI000B8E43D8|nr:hypothetical protein [Vibrio sp. V09_P4A23P171]BCB42054.1 hypothetical protein Vag1382_11800 [Vibrio alginolyticus]OXX38332.1 hypothetical protein B9J90_04035 [Vibrio sp. V09_P4A23P171]BCB46654.1 hypothetical protein VagVIO5_11800 [Vibrio alginolyticus]BCB51255.1 hypothetical protein VagYM19_11810 [Vibrio alginolyticus]BCB55858.1 hypothetical protein VagYM4_11810 [Vibrio alginolyticus]